MEQTNDIVGYKHGKHLVFERNGKKAIFDFTDMEFKRPLKNGELKPFAGTQAFFRNLSVSDVANGFKNPAYAELIRKVNRAGYHRYRNFASVFARLPKYKHLESYLVLEIPFDQASTFNQPVSIYTRDVIAFMKESGITFNTSRWEQQYLKHKSLISKVVTHIRKRHYLDLEVYRMFYAIVVGYNFEKFVKLVSPQATEPEWETTWGETSLVETGYGCEYKTLFDYLVMIDRTEACSFDSALGYYYDYLSMMRKMERSKTIGIMRQTNPNLDVNTVGWVGYGRIEKYPKYLRTRHDIVAKNYRAYAEKCDEENFKRCVNKGYEYSWGKYKMVVPRLSEDIRNEGTTLHHCVASYVKRVLDGTTQIVFMREDVNESLVTVEIRANAIVQARGYNNRSVTDEEVKWLKTYARAKNLNYKDVKRDETMPTPPVTALTIYDSNIARLRAVTALLNG